MNSSWAGFLRKPSAYFRSRAELRRLQRSAHIAQLRDHRSSLLESPRYADERRLVPFGFRVYSQSDEDGILHEIFRRIGETNRTFVEIGSSDGAENNTHFLLLKGWRGVWVEGSKRRVAGSKRSFATSVREGRLRIEHLYVTATQIDEELSRIAPEREIDLLSVDLDGNDYYVLQAIRSVAPRVVVAEYNAKFPPDVAWVMEYNESHRWDGTDYFGASLKSLENMMAKKGYLLVGCNLVGCNAFFVRRDLASEVVFCPPFTAENHYEPARYYLMESYATGMPAGMGPYRVPPLE